MSSTLNIRLRLTVRVLLGLGLLLGFGLGCSRPAAQHTEGEQGHAHEAGHDDAAHAQDGDGTRHLDLEGMRGVRFDVVPEPRQEGAWFPAEAVGDLGAAAVFSAPVAGIVTRLPVGQGQTVAARQALVEIRSPELAGLKAAWLSARARQAQAASELERERRLLAAAATSERDVEAAEAGAAVAEAEEQAARLALEARGVNPETAGTTYVVRAPRAGTLDTVEAALGQAVAAGQALGRLVAPGAALLKVELSLPGPESWAPGATTEARHADGRRWSATVEGTPAELSSATRRLAYRLRLAGTPPPLAGTPLEVRVPLARGMVLPQTALQQIEGVWGVFVKEGEEASFRPVEKGAALGSDVLVLSGLTSGETVAVEGAYLLKSLYLKLAGGGDGHDH